MQKFYDLSVRVKSKKSLNIKLKIISLLDSQCIYSHMNIDWDEMPPRSLKYSGQSVNVKANSISISLLEGALRSIVHPAGPRAPPHNNTQVLRRWTVPRHRELIRERESTLSTLARCPLGGSRCVGHPIAFLWRDGTEFWWILKTRRLSSLWNWKFFAPFLFMKSMENSFIMHFFPLGFQISINAENIKCTDVILNFNSHRSFPRTSLPSLFSNSCKVIGSVFKFIVLVRFLS